MASNVTIRQIQAFQNVADLGSFTRAAERLRVAQPALSQQVRDLELELGIRLFDRTTRRVELTDAGREFYGATAKILEGLEAAMRNAQDLAERKRGKVVVAAPPLLAAVILPPAIADFRSKFPGIRIELIDARTDQIINQVRSGSVDCGLGTFRVEEEGLLTTPITRDSLMLFCNAKDPVAQQGSIHWKALQGLPFVTLTKDSGIRLLVEIGFESAQIALAPSYEVSHVTTALAMVEAGLGVCVLPTYAWAGSRGKLLAAVPLVDPIITRDIVMITPAGKSVSPAVSAFSRFLSKHTVAMLPSTEAY